MGVSVKVMGPTGGDPAAAWKAFRTMLDEDESQREAVRRIAETPEGRAMLDASRDAWRGCGREAPFEIVFREGATR